MKNKKRLLLITPGQFGYQSGYYYYVKHLKEKYLLKFLCPNMMLPKMDIEGLDITYFNYRGNKLLRHFKWMKSVYREIKSADNNTIVFMVYFKLCFIWGLIFPQKFIVLDIRTGSVKPNAFKNWLQNKQIKFETLFFKRITILSKGLIKHIGIEKTKCHWLPLGADSISALGKGFEHFKLIYVGVFNYRRIHETVRGLKIFLDREKTSFINISYDIFGFADGNEVDLLLEEIKVCNLEDVVFFHGRKNHNELNKYFDVCNIGVSYIPITPYFEFQPPTKTFEYLMSGMICVATNTYENRKIINKNNGVLCKDNPQSFADGLQRVYNNRKFYNSPNIKATVSESSWESIVSNNLKKYLNNI